MIDTYLETQVLTASPQRLHLMVVDGALRFARQAEVALEAKDIETAFLTLSRSRDCVAELIGGLEGEQAPELVEQMKSLFVYVYRNLARADLEKNPQLVRDAIRILELHRETWLELIEKLHADTPPTTSSIERTWVG